MLKRVGDREFPGKTEVFIKEASFPVPFQPGLEFNSPAHGNWNIVQDSFSSRLCAVGVVVLLRMYR